MAYNPPWEIYSEALTNEHLYAESLYVEFTDISGVEIHYYRIDPSNMDPIYGEDPNMPFYGKKVTKVLMPITGSAAIINIFGMVDDMQLNDVLIPKYIFKRDVYSAATASPRVGDVIYVPWNERLFEVTWVDDQMDNGMFLAKYFIWQLSIRPFRASSQNDTLDTLMAPLINPDGAMTTLNISAVGDNDAVEEEHLEIEPYTNIDTTIYGY